MSDLISLLIAAFPVIAFAALIAETVRTGTGPHGDQPPADLFYRAYSA
jgi:hypothetical protein